MFGGRNDYNDKLNDTWEFDISSKKWDLISCEKSPIGRSEHVLINHDGKMILFGGIIEITKEINEIEQFEFSSRKWSSIDDKSDMRKYSTIGSPIRSKEQLNETAPIGNDANMSTMAFKRDKANKSMKKLHRGADLSELDEKNKNFHLLKDPPKYNKKKAKLKQNQEDYDQKRNSINTPITGNLRNTFVIKNHNEKFDQYYYQMKRKRNDTNAPTGYKSLMNQCIKSCDRPTARDGHSCNVYKSRLYVLGGDRHHMSYNDAFALKLD